MVAPDNLIVEGQKELTLTINEQQCPYVLQIQNDDGEDIVRICRNGDVEILGSVNDAAMRFWTAMTQIVGSDLIKFVKENRSK